MGSLHSPRGSDFQSCWSFTLQSVQQFYMVFRCVYYMLWPEMFPLNSMFILVTPINKTAKLNLQVKEVLVVQAKKDTSKLVKKQEEVTQVRKGGNKKVFCNERRIFGDPKHLPAKWFGPKRYEKVQYFETMMQSKLLNSPAPPSAQHSRKNCNQRTPRAIAIWGQNLPPRPPPINYGTFKIKQVGCIHVWSKLNVWLVQGSMRFHLMESLQNR